MSVYEHRSSNVRRNLVWRRARAKVARRLLRAIHRWQRNRAAAAFEALPDTYLGNIGLARANLSDVADGLFPRSRRLVPVRPAGRSDAVARDWFHSQGK